MSLLKRDLDSKLSKSSIKEKKLSESSDQYNSKRRVPRVPADGRSSRAQPWGPQRFRGPVRLCQRARERNWGEQALWLCLLPVSAKLLCEKKHSTEKGNAKGAQSHELRACTLLSYCLAPFETRTKICPGAGRLF